MYLGAFPAPQQGSGQSALLNFSLRNTLEMKAKSLRDTSSTYKKISLLEMFDFATSYNIITRTWSNITFNTGTRLLNNKVDIRLTSTIDPYSIDSLGQDSRQLQLLKHEGIGRITNANLNIGLNLTSSQGGKKKENKPEEATVPNSGVQNDMDRQNQLNKPGQDVDFTVPWSANVTYTFTYSKPASKVSLIQSASVRGDLSLTPKWKIGVKLRIRFSGP